MSRLRVPLRKSVAPGIAPVHIDGEVVPLDPVRHVAQAAGWRPSLGAAAEEDATWDWAALLQEADTNESQGVGRYEGYALECGGELQALMLLETAAHRSRQTGDPVVYVEYVAVAPWNRRTMQSPPRFVGCGSGIISMAIERSQALGFKGAIALHSLPRAAGFYTNLGMQNLGPDPTENGLHYFELV